MLNLPIYVKGVVVRPLLSFLLPLTIIFYSPTHLSSQTIFDYAIQMDSLYNQLKAGDESAAKLFFEIARKVAGVEQYNPSVDIIRELGVAGLDVEVQYANKLYNLSKRLETDELSIYKNRRDSIAGKVYDLLNIPQSTVKNVLNTGGDFDVIMDLFVDLDAQPDSIYRKVILLMIEIEDIEEKIKIYEGLKTNNSGLSQKDEALDAFPITAEGTVGSASPIIIQNQVGGSAQSAIIDGAAKWIAERMRQELSIAFFDRFENWAENKNITQLFPNTLSVLKSSANTDYTLMMEIYKHAFQNDLHELTFNIPSFLENEIIDEADALQLRHSIAQLDHEIQKRDRLISYYEREKDAERLGLIKQKQSYQKELDKQQYIKYLSFSLQTIDQLQQGQHPANLLNTLHTKSYELFPENNRLQSVLLLLHSISQSLTATNAKKNTVWIGNAVIDQLKSNAQLRKFYFGLLVTKVRAEIRKQQKRQSIITNNAIPQEKRLEISNKIKTNRALYDRFQSFLGGTHPTDPLRVILDTLETSFVLESFLNSTYAEGIVTPQLLDQTQLADYLEVFKYSNYHDFLRDASQLRSKDIFNLMSIEKYFYTDFTEQQFIEKYFIKAYFSTRYVEYFYQDPDPYDFFYYCQKEPTFEAAKAAYFDRISYQPLKEGFGFQQQYNTASTINYIDSINNVRLKDRYDFYEKYFKSVNENSPGIARFNFNRRLEDQIFTKDSLNLLYQSDIQSPAFLASKYRMKQLADQTEFMRSFIVGDHSYYRFKAPKVSKLFNDFVQYTNKIDQINTQFKELRSKNQTNLGNQEFIYLIKNSMDILDIIFEYTVDKNNPNMVRNMGTVQFATDNLLNAYIAGLSEDYNGVITYIIPVVEKLITNKYEKLIQPLEEEARASLTEEQLSMGFLPRSVALDSLRLLRDDKLRKMQEVFKYCTFIAAVAKSNDSEDVKKAINAIALPVGSYGIKRRTYANISLNAYTGITGGLELVQNRNFSSWAPNFGFTAPIGIGINWGYRSKINEGRYRKNQNYRNRVQKSEVGMDDRIFSGHSGSFFFSFVDLGALVLFRLNDSTEPLPEDVGIEQIFSPGVAYVHGLPRVPISIMTGAQLTPNLRKVGEGANIERANSFRFNVSIVVDLPMANFYTRRRPKR